MNPASCLYILDVGYGAASSIVLADTTIVIDCKAPDPDSRQADIRCFIQRDYIDLLVITHSHKDHWSGLPALLDTGVNIGTCWVTAYTPNPDDPNVHADHQREYNKLLDDLAHATTIQEMHEGCAPYECGNARFTVLNPPADIKTSPPEHIHDACLILRCDTPTGSVIFGSDALATAWRRILKKSPGMLPVDVLLASHHGARDGVDHAALLQMEPRWVIISTREGQYPGTPDDTALTWYHQAARETMLRTDQVGTIRITQAGVFTDRIDTNSGMRAS